MSGTKLTQLFLFNPSWGPREGQEEEKVVFHWPAHLDANTRVRSVGLIEAVVRWASLSFTFNWTGCLSRFGETFSREPAESLHNLKSRQVWRQVRGGGLEIVEEKAFPGGAWILPRSLGERAEQQETRQGGRTGQAAISCLEIFQQNIIVKVEWRPEDVSDSVLLAVLQRAYDMFHLFQVGINSYTWLSNC